MHYGEQAQRAIGADQPQARWEADRQQHVETGGGSSSTRRGAANGGPTRNATILIVENEVNNRRLIEQILGFAGYSYRSATNGMEALDLLDHEIVDLVLLDLSMPILDGYRTTELMRERPDTATLPIIAVTAHAMSDDRELAIHSGCSDYLAKPFRPAELLGVVERWLARTRASDAG